MPSRTIAVVGATGAQGGGVVDSLLQSPEFKVRALSSDPESLRARALLEKHKDAAAEGRIELVKGDLNDPLSLEEALVGADSLFAAFADSADQEEQGKRLVDATKAANIKHFVYSSLPSITKLSGGKFTSAGPFDAKAAVADYAIKQLENVTLLFAGAFYSNLKSTFYAKRVDNVVQLCLPIGSSRKIQWVDECRDIGVFAAAVFSAPLSTVTGKTYSVMAAPQTLADLAAEYEAATGEKAVAAPQIMEDALAAIPEEQKETWRSMYGWRNAEPADTIAYGSMAPDEDLALQELGVKASTLTEFLKRTGFRVP
ncbi:hypothetical protein JCM6882_003248 [Rhodosporidiobolus microsporus]